MGGAPTAQITPPWGEAAQHHSQPSPGVSEVGGGDFTIMGTFMILMLEVGGGEDSSSWTSIRAHPAPAWLH